MCYIYLPTEFETTERVVTVLQEMLSCLADGLHFFFVEKKPKLMMKTLR